MRRNGLALAIFVGLAVDASTGLAETGIAPPKQALAVAFSPVAALPPGTNLVSVLYATDRRMVGTGTNAADYSDFDSSKSLSFGLCTVSIPKDHRLGEFETPFFKLLSSIDKHIVLLTVSPRTDQSFFSFLNSKLGQSKEKSILVFVHGFDVTFEDAVRRTAQIAYDLKFPGAPVAYTWPSANLGLMDFEGIETNFGPLVNRAQSKYSEAEENQQRSALQFSRFLSDLADRSRANRIFLIAHSMGGRLLTTALRELSLTRGSRKLPILREIILAAPDMDADLFKEFVKAFSASAGITLYASSNDKVLVVSQALHGGHARAGQSGTGIVVADGLDTVDASAADTSFAGHSYYADSTSVVGDIYYLIQGVPPERRVRLRASEDGRFWIFR